MLRERSGRLRKAELLSAYPENPIVHLLFARTSAGLGDAHSAAIHFQRALMLEPHLIGAHLHYAELLARRGDVQQALQHVEAGYKRVHTWESQYSGSADPLRVRRSPRCCRVGSKPNVRADSQFAAGDSGHGPCLRGAAFGGHSERYRAAHSAFSPPGDRCR